MSFLLVCDRWWMRVRRFILPLQKRILPFFPPPRDAFRARTRGREWRLPCRIQSKVEDAVAEKMLDGTLKTGDTAKLAVEDNKLVVTK